MTLVGYRDSYYQDFYRDLAEGRLRGINPILEFGYNDSFGTTRETLTATGGLYYWLPSAQSLAISSTSSNDTDGGTGANEVVITGLDANYEPISETITLNGTTVVSSSQNFLRIREAEVTKAGSLESNDGDISVQDNAQNNTVEIIESGKGVSQSAVWTVPANRQSYLSSWFGSELSNKGIKIELWLRDIESGVWKERRLSYLFGAEFERAFTLPYPIEAKSDIEIRVVGIQTDSKASGGFSGY